MRSLLRAGSGGWNPGTSHNNWQQPALHDLAACYGHNLHNTLQRCRKPGRPPAGCTVRRYAGLQSSVPLHLPCQCPPFPLAAHCQHASGMHLPTWDRNSHLGQCASVCMCPARRARLDSTAAFLHAPAPWWALEGEPPVRYLLPTRALPAAPARLRRCTTSTSCAQCSQKRWNCH